MRALRHVYHSLGKALRASGAAQGVGKLLHQQRLVAVQGVQAFKPALDVFGQLGGRKVHTRYADYSAVTAAKRRMIC